MKTKALVQRILSRGNILPAAIAGIFIALAGKIAFVRQFPLPYDESFHVGLIRLYTHHLNPFLASQPAGADVYGAVARDPSYLYHYLMSFPLRLFQAVGLSDFGQIIALRSLNIALGLVTIYLTYRLARRLGMSKLGGQLVALALAATPVFYDVAAQVNYDNLLVPIALLTVLMALRLCDAVKQGKVAAAQLAGLISLLMVGTLVKYSFLPIAAAVAIYVGWQLLRRLGVRATLAGFAKSVIEMQRGKLLVVAAVTVLASVCWLQRYGVNLAQYHTPHPQCHVVLSVQDCSVYGPWARNYQLHETAAQRPIGRIHLVGFSLTWVKLMYSELFSTVYNTPTSSGLFKIYAPLLGLGTLIVAGAVFAAIFVWRRLRQHPTVVALLGISVSYGAVLWLQNYSDFDNLHMIVAVQGRYLLPVLPILYAIIGLVYVNAFEHVRITAALDLVLSLRHRVAATALQFSNALSFDGRLQTWPPSDGLHFELTEWSPSEERTDK